MYKTTIIHKIISVVIIYLAFFQTTQSFGQEQEEDKAPRTIPELQHAIEKVLKDTETPAIGLALINGDSTIWIDGLGKANIEKDINANDMTMFRIGSVSKMYVSLAILKLQEEGRISLKDKISDLVPEIEYKNPWAETSPILVEHLLEHTTGWDDIHLTEYSFNEPDLSLKDGLDYHPHSRISRWIPGTRMSYCNSGPPVAAYIVEKITGQTFEDYIQTNFFQPLGMENMTYFETDYYKQHGAALYIDGKAQDYWNIIMRPSGSINASPKDMAKMVQFFINRGQVDSLQLISKESLKRMESPSTTIGARVGLESGYGLANYTSSHKGFVYRGHNGGVNGGLTEFAYLPDHNMGYAFMINSNNGGAFRQISDLICDFQIKDLERKQRHEESKITEKEDAISAYYISISPRSQMFYFLEPLLNIQHIWLKDDSLFQKDILDDHTKTYLMKNETHFISTKSGIISLVQVKDPLDGMVIQTGSQTLKSISSLRVFGQFILGGLWILGIISSILFGMIWSIRYWLGKIPGGANVWIRLWPLITSLIFLSLVALLNISASDLFEIGKVNLRSVSISILTICFAIVSIWSVYYMIRNRKKVMNRIIYWYYAILAYLHLIFTCYLLWYGVIGIQLWS